MGIRELTCICCPLGCSIRVGTNQGPEVVSVSGNSCLRGHDYAVREVTDPTRTVTTAVRIEGGSEPMLPVKTAHDIPKGRIHDCMKALKEVRAKAPVHIGDVIARNIAGTGVDIVATKDVL